MSSVLLFRTFLSTSHNATHSISGFFRNDSRSLHPILFPPTRATLILSEGATLLLAFASMLRGKTDPAARTEVVLIKFLRVEVMIILVFLKNESKGNILLCYGQFTFIKKY